MKTKPHLNIRLLPTADVYRSPQNPFSLYILCFSPNVGGQKMVTFQPYEWLWEDIL